MGITDNAQNKLGDITYLGFPDEGAVFEEGESMGEIESPKAVSDIYAPTELEVGRIKNFRIRVNLVSEIECGSGG